MNEILTVIITVASVILAALFDSETDTIQFKPAQAWSNARFWVVRNYNFNRFESKILKWLFRYPLSFANDGWHFTKSTSIVLLLFPAVNFAILYYNGGVEYLFFGLIGSYIIYGSIFNIFYHN